MTNLTINDYQGQICSSGYLNNIIPKKTLLFDGDNLNQYIAKISIFARSGTHFTINQSSKEKPRVDIEIG